MKVQLNKNDLINLVKGSDPLLTMVKFIEERKFAIYSDQYGRWTWNKHELNKLDEQTLWTLYNVIIKDKNENK